MAVNFTQVDYILTLHNEMNQSIDGSMNTDPGGEGGTEGKVRLHNISLDRSNVTLSTHSSISTAIPKVHWSPEMDTSTLFPPTDSATLPHDHNMAPLGLLTILILAVIGNITVCLVVKMDRHLHHMTYYFFVSLAVVHLLMVAVVMPPAILIILNGESYVFIFVLQSDT